MARSDEVKVQAGQTWRRRDVTYEIVAQHDDVLDVRVVAYGRSDRWSFTVEKFHNLIAAESLRPYDPTARLDALAQRLEACGHADLATALDRVTTEYVEAVLPSKLKRLRVRRSDDQLESLIDEAEQAADPRDRERIIRQTQNQIDELDESGPHVPPTNLVDPGTFINDSNQVAEPTHVSRG